MPPRRKRTAGSAEGSRPSKQPKLEAELVEDSDDDESMESILARIREQEENEALARQHKAGVVPGPSSSMLEVGDSGERDNPVAVYEGEGEDETYDEDAAIRWAMEESMKAEASVQASRRESLRLLSQSRQEANTPDASSSQPIAAASTYHSTESDVPPDVQLAPHSTLFTDGGVCSACSKTIEAPHNLVSLLFLLSLRVRV